MQDELLASAKLLATYGPRLGRPHVDTLKGSSFPNMKELRFTVAKADERYRAHLDRLTVAGKDKR